MRSPLHNRILATLILAAAVAFPMAARSAGNPYPATTQANADIAAALKEAAATKKRVLVDFGGNWCPDCKVLDINLHRPENAALLKQSFILVHVNVGEKGIDTNLDIGDRYGIPLKKGVPALAVLDADGKVVHAQKSGEFESMRKLDPKAVNDFLVKWKP